MREQSPLEQLTCATSAATDVRMSPGSLLLDGPAPGVPFLQQRQALQLLQQVQSALTTTPATSFMIAVCRGVPCAKRMLQSKQSKQCSRSAMACLLVDSCVVALLPLPSLPLRSASAPNCAAVRARFLSAACLAVPCRARWIMASVGELPGTPATSDSPSEYSSESSDAEQSAGGV